MDLSEPRYRGSDGRTNTSSPVGDSVLHAQSTHSPHPGAREILGPHRGEDISIEAFDGHWPASISRVRGTRPWRCPRTSGRGPRGSLLPPLLLAFFLLPDPHQLHSPSLPADDHCRGMDGHRRDSGPQSSSWSPLPPFPSEALGFHSPLPTTITPFHPVTAFPDFPPPRWNFPQFFYSCRGLYAQHHLPNCCCCSDPPRPDTIPLSFNGTAPSSLFPLSIHCLPIQFSTWRSQPLQGGEQLFTGVS